MQIQLNFAVIRQRRLRLRRRLRVVGLSAVGPGLFALFAHTHTHCAGLILRLGLYPATAAVAVGPSAIAQVAQVDFATN